MEIAQWIYKTIVNLKRISFAYYIRTYNSTFEHLAAVRIEAIPFTLIDAIPFTLVFMADFLSLHLIVTKKARGDKPD